MKIIKLQIKDLLPRRKKNQKCGTWYTERSYNELLKKKNKLEDKLREAEYCLTLIDVHTASLGGKKKDMIESLADIYNICRVYFREAEEKDLADFTIKLVEWKGKVK